MCEIIDHKAPLPFKVNCIRFPRLLGVRFLGASRLFTGRTAKTENRPPSGWLTGKLLLDTESILHFFSLFTVVTAKPNEWPWICKVMRNAWKISAPRFGADSEANHAMTHRAEISLRMIIDPSRCLIWCLAVRNCYCDSLSPLVLMHRVKFLCSEARAK